jgi:high-affinity nickel-transport protein
VGKVIESGLTSGVGNVGGIIGAAVSGSFLFLIACINIYFLVEAIRHRQKVGGELAIANLQLKRRLTAGLPEEPVDHAIHGGGLMVRIVGPLLRAVDRPWKMYPVGILFGFGR